MNQIFPKFPKDIRRLLWYSYLTYLDRYMVFMAFLSKKINPHGILYELVGYSGNLQHFLWMQENGYKAFKIAARWNRIEFCKALQADEETLYKSAMEAVAWERDNVCLLILEKMQDNSKLLEELSDKGYSRILMIYKERKFLEGLRFHGPYLSPQNPQGYPQTLVEFLSK